jgi:Tfp pilus assembly protein PilF
MSQHNLRLGNIDEALSFINKAIEHTPTVVELYLVKAKIFQFGGNRK